MRKILTNLELLKEKNCEIFADYSLIPFNTWIIVGNQFQIEKYVPYQTTNAPVFSMKQTK